MDVGLAVSWHALIRAGDHRNQSFRSDNRLNQPVTLEGFNFLRQELPNGGRNTSLDGEC